VNLFAVQQCAASMEISLRAIFIANGITQAARLVIFHRIPHKTVVDALSRKRFKKFLPPSFHTHTMSVIEIAEPSDKQEIMDLLTACKLSTEHVDNADVWLVRRNRTGGLIGCMSLERRDNRVHIQSLCVAKQNRREGIARALIECAFENYLFPGDYLTALTLPWNKPFYQRVGFHQADAAWLKKADDVGAREKHHHCMALVREKS